MARILLTFDGVPPMEHIIARTNTENLDPGDIIPGPNDGRWRVTNRASPFDYLLQCADASVEVDEVKVMEEKDCFWWVEEY